MTSASIELVAPVTKEKAVSEMTQFAHWVENATEAQAKAALEEICNANELSDFKLGGILCRINETKEWQGDSSNFREYVETNLNIHYRKASYLAKTYRTVMDSKVDLAEIEGLGWTKMKEIAPFLGKEGYDTALLIQKAHDLPRAALVEYLKELKVTGGKDTEAADAAASKKKLSFSVHADDYEQIEAALDHAKQEGGFKFENECLGALAMGYLASSNPVSKPAPVAEVVAEPVEAAPTPDLNLQTVMEVKGLEATLIAFQKAFPTVNFSFEMEQLLEAGVPEDSELFSE